MRIAVVGTGYVGLVAGTCFAETGHVVVCVDVDEAKVQTLRRGETPIYEPGLEELLARNLKAERLSFTTDLPGAVRGAEVVFIVVGTPQGDDGNADLRTAMKVAHDIADTAERYTVIVAFSERARAVVAELYAPFVRTESPIYFMDPASAELTKYAANAMLAMRISFINEMANLCERVGADVDAVRKALGADKRIGHPFLFPGVGYGGSCFPKDVKALVAIARNQGLDFALLAAVDAVNDRQKRLLAQKARAHFGPAGGVRGRKVAVWGLAFKPKTDDIRAAPALALIEELLADGAVVAAHDPVAMEPARRQLGARVQYAANPYAAVEGAQALFLVTEWNEFRQPDFARVKQLMARPVVFDGRNIWNPQRLAELGFTYHGVGRNRT